MAALASSFGSGGGSYSSSASSRGEASSGSGSVNVGAFNPPAYGFSGGNSQTIVLGVVAVFALIYFMRKK